MEDLINWIDEQGYMTVLSNQEISHERIEEQKKRKGYVPVHKKYTVQLLKDVPTRAGVYIFFDEQGHTAYVGKTSNLRDRIRQHLTGHSNAKEIRGRFHRFAFIRCFEWDAKNLEKLIIEREQPYGNQLGVTI
ncbi:GIY-YIG nuclease family protein (plasmid) [Bacillus licheniformis]|uniref:GIY-YIG nuclease family protein n=1 Tax=Bacillus licheniformis TaxID=1402 RepID=UPI0031F51C3F